MAHKVNDEPNGCGVVVALAGHVDGDEIYRLNLELMADRSFRQWRYQIWDFSAVEEFEASFDDLRQFARQDAEAAKINPNQRIAIIPRRAGSSHMDGVFHVYEAVWGAYESRTFHDLASARAWASRAAEGK